ncbi:hypothetical protein BLA60_33230 [Actinophytocola xinjiangensis]|uniref:Uncharacterized protein n=1 Tax=Actinophytocola xinjiangensis TaxID=485602 RepID=A0A7Z0WIL7_9PSEU|nr:hypothetical protein [Actinophytocola xinjiangensis]OLF06196.1 hypothetical protein BLA60_33230 [Actinophytocola xinjiangensis]
MIGVRLRYTMSGLGLRFLGLIRYSAFPHGDRHTDAFRSISRLSSFVDLDDPKARRRAKTLAVVLAHSYIRAHQLTSAMARHMGTGRYRLRHLVEADLVIDRLVGLSDVDDAWELTFRIARMRDLADGIPDAAVLTRTLADAHDLARDLALSGADFTMRVLVVRLSPLSRMLLSASVSLLPAEHRDRFGAEFRAELYYLRPSRKRQVMYAARQLRHALRLRRSLRAPNGQAEHERRSDP